MVTDNLARIYAKPDQSEIIISESPLKWCTVSLSNVILRGKRLEASVFDVEARQAYQLIAKGKYKPKTLCGPGGFAIAYTCGRFKRIWVKKSQFPIFQPSSIADIKPVPSGYLSRLTKTDIEALRVHKGQILMTCSGTIGKVSYVSKTLDNLVFSHDLLRITCNNANDAGYVYAYLKSDIGNKILLANSYGAVITHIEADHLDAVPVPCAPLTLRRRISDLIEQSYALRDESNKLIDEATGLLVDELKLPPINEFHKVNTSINTFGVKLSNLNLRLDASYHVPVVDAIIAHLQEHAAEVTAIGDSRISKDVILPGRFKRVYVDVGYGRVFIGGKQLGELDPTNKKYLSPIHHGDRIKKQLELHENTTLITCSGTIGKIALVGKHWERWTANQHIIRVVPASVDIAGYINVFLASDYGYELITRYTYGSVVDEIDDNHVSQIPIPFLRNQGTQHRINDLALEANAKRYKAYQLEQEALKTMNDEVIYAK